MSTQIAVRLPDDIVEFVDQVVASGEAPSRAAVVARLLDRERRARAAVRDAQIYKAAAGRAGELDALARWAAGQPADVD